MEATTSSVNSERVGEASGDAAAAVGESETEDRLNSGTEREGAPVVVVMRAGSKSSGESVMRWISSSARVVRVEVRMVSVIDCSPPRIGSSVVVA